MSNQPLTKRQHLALICKRIGEHVGVLYGGELNARIEQVLSEECRSRLQEPAPEELAPPEEAAKIFMRQAGGVKTIPAPSRWDIDPELKRKLEALFDSFVQKLAGPHAEKTATVGAILMDPSIHVLVKMPDGKHVTMSGAEAAGSFVWWHLTRDAAFMKRMMLAFEAYAERMPFEQFRKELIEACRKAKVGSAEDAIPVLDTLTRSYAAQYLS